ncbi:hypothetical protein CBR_g11971 [Chara braunii]|uniref:Chromo domain-containing protein n=1 Tax=Chara braunii TaxID=69332 RepID=A0A388KR33_CHABU|nr:hypothetical protein CBR_g11971 [Chara braunii]|eukprot:GBG72393.1 hypothetical protein CBR_g11971 [Chara braunii]
MADRDDLRGYRPRYMKYSWMWEREDEKGTLVEAVLSYGKPEGEVRLKINVCGHKEQEMRRDERLQAAITKARNRAERRCRRDGVTAGMRVTVTYHEDDSSIGTTTREVQRVDRDSEALEDLESEWSNKDPRESWVALRKGPRGEHFVVEVDVGGRKCGAFIDIGSTRNYISRDCLERLHLQDRVRHPSRPVASTLAKKERMIVTDYIKDVVCTFSYGGGELNHKISFLVSDDLPFEMLLGMYYLEVAKPQFDWEKKVLKHKLPDGRTVRLTKFKANSIIDTYGCLCASAFYNYYKQNQEEGMYLVYVLEKGKAVKTPPEIERVVAKFPDLFEEPTGDVEREVVHAIEITPGRQSVSMDFMDTLVTSKSGKRHIFVIIDRFTKYARLVAMLETARTDFIIKLFKDNWVRRRHSGLFQVLRLRDDLFSSLETAAVVCLRPGTWTAGYSRSGAITAQRLPVEPLDWAGQYYYSSEPLKESEEELDVFIAKLATVTDTVERNLMLEEKRAELNIKLLTARRQEVEEKKRLQAEGEKLQKALEEQKDKPSATEKQLALLREAVLNTRQDMVLMCQNLQRVETHRVEFETVWNNFLEKSSKDVDQHVQTYIRALDEHVTKTFTPEVIDKIVKGAGGGGGDGDDDGDDDKKGKRDGDPKGKLPQETGQVSKIKLKLSWTYNGKKEESVLHWAAAIETYVYGQRSPYWDRVLMATSCMGGDAMSFAISLQKEAGCSSMVEFSQQTRIEDFLKAIRERPIDRLNPDQVHKLPLGTSEFAIQYQKDIAKVKENIIKAQHQMIEQANKHRRPSQFAVGDLVWVKSKEFAPEENISQKLLPAYRGPWQVLDVIGDVDGPSYVIEILHLHTYPVFHASKLFPCVTNELFPSHRSAIPPSMDGKYDVDKIVAENTFHIGRRGRPQRQFKVRFAYQDPSEDCWFTREELLDSASHIVSAYERGKRGIHIIDR